MPLPTFTNFESKNEKLIPRVSFAQRWILNLLTALIFMLVSLFVGMAGYHITEQMSWLDAFANASMILGGMGPLGELHTTAGKLFAGIYALYSGVAFIAVAALILAPVAHRLLHRFHVDEEDEK